MWILLLSLKWSSTKFVTVSGNQIRDVLVLKNLPAMHPNHQKVLTSFNPPKHSNHAKYNSHLCMLGWICRLFNYFARNDWINIRNTGESSQLRKHGFGSLHNLTWTCYHSEDIFRWHRLNFTKKLTKFPSIRCFLNGNYWKRAHPRNIDLLRPNAIKINQNMGQR